MMILKLPKLNSNCESNEYTFIGKLLDFFRRNGTIFFRFTDLFVEKILMDLFINVAKEKLILQH